MRLNKFIAASSVLSRRAADEAVAQNRVMVNGRRPQSGQQVAADDVVELDGQVLQVAAKMTILFHKPVGYVCSRDGQGNRTIYELLPPELSLVNSIGRLDKESSGLLLLTNDGALANQLSHPRYAKTKVYTVKLDKMLQPLHRQMISDHGIMLEDGLSRFEVSSVNDNQSSWQVTLREGRNRQIRRTFEALGYSVTALKRTAFGNYQLGNLASGHYRQLTDAD